MTLTSGETIGGDYALCTFSLGVLQDDYVTFEPPLPDYKMEAIQSMTMATYTKIFLKFPEKFWFDTEVNLFLLLRNETATNVVVDGLVCGSNARCLSGLAIVRPPKLLPRLRIDIRYCDG